MSRISGIGNAEKRTDRNLQELRNRGAKFETETGKSESISRTDTNQSGAGTTDKKQKLQLIKQ